MISNSSENKCELEGTDLCSKILHGLLQSFKSVSSLCCLFPLLKYFISTRWSQFFSALLKAQGNKWWWWCFFSVC